MRIEYKANNGTRKSVEVSKYNNDMLSDGRFYMIDDSGQYLVLKVNVMGKCNTYWRTIGSYPLLKY